MKNRLAICVVGLSWAAFTAGATAAVVEGRTQQDRRFIAGGVGIEEVDQMRQHAAQFPLQLIVAARSGAYLANTDIRITGPQGTVLQTTLDAPWLLVDLPAGTYTVVATNRGITQQRQVTIGANGRQQIVMHFDVPVDQPAAANDQASGQPTVPPLEQRPAGTTR